MVTLLGNLIPTPDVIQHERFLGDGSDGPVWAAAVERRGRWQAGEKRVQLPDGRVVVLTATVFLPGEVEVSIMDKLNGHAVERVDTATWWDGTAMHHEAGVV